MTSRIRLALAVGAWATLVSCADSFDPTAQAAPPDSVGAQALGMHAVRISWARSTNAAAYTLERRANLTGPFVPVKQFSSGFVTQYTDDSLAPETIYGYRLVTTSLTGVRSGPSLVAGARTAPIPGVVAAVATTPPELADPNGYMVTVVRNSDTLRARLGPLDQHRFSPLPPGTYHVALWGVPPHCAVAGGAAQTDTVTDQGLQTLRYASFNVSCRDPDVGRLTVHIATTGDSVDADGYELIVSGLADDATLPDAERAFFRRDTVTPQALRNYEALRPGNYSVELTGVATNCIVQGAASRPIRVNALGDLSQAFSITCQQTEDLTRPLVWRSRWSSPTAPSGSKVSLDVSLDLSHKPGQRVADVQATLRYDPTVVHLDSVRQVSPWTVSANEAPSGTVAWLAFVTGAGLTDSTTFARFYFTVTGAAGSQTTSGTSFIVVEDALGNNLIPLTRKNEGTFTVASGIPVNQPPVARPGGPYSGTVGAPISFSGGTSSDPDGSVAGCAWTFGDGASSTGTAPTHAYAAAGTYTVTLTVTDDGQLTGTATTTATVTPSGNQVPIATVNGPYSGVVGTPIAFSASGSTDPDGTIASYAWNFGDGGTATGATPMHTYASAASFAVTLAVTDNLGATGSATTNAAITPGGAPRPFTWRSDFGPVRPIDSLVTLTVALDLSTDIPETPGPEALASWRVDSLKWDPRVLRYVNLTFGPEGAGSETSTDALTGGKLVLNGVQSVYGSTGLVTIAVITFKVIGASGSTTTTATALGTLLGTPATGPFSYGPSTSVLEGTLQAP